MINKNPKKGWTPNWSGRGIALLDSIERQYEKSYQTFVPTRRTISPQDKLNRLIKRYPTRRFYNSLLWQLQKYPLSKKQVELIELDYWKYF